MSVQVINADVMDGLRSLDSESVQCCVTSRRSSAGQFVAGVSASPATQFKKGQHWRPRKPHWDRDWLQREYVDNKRSCSEIAAETGCRENNIHFWLKKHGIAARSVSEVRSMKHWGLPGSLNAMFGRTGALSPSYVDGSSPERQRAYVRAEGRAFLRAVYARDGYRCQRCAAPNTGPKSLHAHHIKPWAGNPSVRFDMSNAVTLCRQCHSWVHSKRNTAREWLA